MKHAMLAGAFLVASATLVAADKGPKTARAELKDAQGKVVATAKLKQVKSGVKISLAANGLPAGAHAFHIHAVGTCEPPDFKTAGGHFNPEHKQHGMNNPEGPHAGDMPNFTVGANGKGKTSYVDTRVRLGEGDNSLFHEGGTALVIHEKADDNMSDPAGNAGNRIACGVIEKSQ
ncbi:MAG: superoxide dismutase family protein [Acidobacteriia bacterium]|nr:superoxide dismutase family protein [Terriglobia bacterium]